MWPKLDFLLSTTTNWQQWHNYVLILSCDPFKQSETSFSSFHGKWPNPPLSGRLIEVWNNTNFGTLCIHKKTRRRRQQRRQREMELITKKLCTCIRHVFLCISLSLQDYKVRLDPKLPLGSVARLKAAGNTYFVKQHFACATSFKTLISQLFWRRFR